MFNYVQTVINYDILSPLQKSQHDAQTDATKQGVYSASKLVLSLGGASHYVVHR